MIQVSLQRRLALFDSAEAFLSPCEKIVTFGKCQKFQINPCWKIIATFLKTENLEFFLKFPVKSLSLKSYMHRILT